MRSDGLHQPGRSYFFTQEVMCVCGQPVVAVDEGHKGEGFIKAGELQLLKYIKTLLDITCKCSSFSNYLQVVCFSTFFLLLPTANLSEDVLLVQSSSVTISVCFQKVVPLSGYKKKGKDILVFSKY